MAYHDRLGGRLDRRHIARATIAVVGLGMVGSPIAYRLAKLGPRRLILVDGDDYQLENCIRHVLPREYIGMNKAVSMADFIEGEVDGVEEIVAIPEYVTESVSVDDILKDILAPATLVVVATHDVAVNRAVALLARQVDLPAVVPAVSPDGRRGEVFVSLTTQQPCIVYYDGFRATTDPVRNAALLTSDIQPTVTLAVYACLGILDPRSRDAELYAPLRSGGPAPQLFRAWAPGSPELQAGDDGRTEVTWRPNCPRCGGQPTQPTPPPLSPSPPPRPASPRRPPPPPAAPARPASRPAAPPRRSTSPASPPATTPRRTSRPAPTPLPGPSFVPAALAPQPTPASRARGRGTILWLVTVALLVGGGAKVVQWSQQHHAQQQQPVPAAAETSGYANPGDLVMAWGVAASSAEGCPLLTVSLTNSEFGSEADCQHSNQWEAVNYDLQTVDEQGDQATVTVQDPDGTTEQFSVLRTPDRGWLIDGIRRVIPLQLESAADSP